MPLTLPRSFAIPTLNVTALAPALNVFNRSPFSLPLDNVAIWPSKSPLPHYVTPCTSELLLRFSITPQNPLSNTPTVVVAGIEVVYLEVWSPIAKLIVTPFEKLQSMSLRQTQTMSLVRKRATAVEFKGAVYSIKLLNMQIDPFLKVFVELPDFRCCSLTRPKIAIFKVFHHFRD